jgi:hypothetical protein
MHGILVDKGHVDMLHNTVYDKQSKARGSGSSAGGNILLAARGL